MALEDDFSSEESDNDSNENDTGDDANDSPMMSIFASYYGIEEPTDDKPKGTIDDVNFEPESYVKKLLINETVEGLIAKDTEMVHEIRTLDGEMQKLVYDNYNKFITATETIKEMKNDVHGMDLDMEEVKLKMDLIAKSSGALDEVLQDKRSQVDKLVRVRRLLNRLEFLSELPERLAEMIDHKLYKEAVQLYNKTISVLTRHQHVLSFKNIKERTELMMKDLTGKVLLMLDDVTLEDVKLTQYVTVLRLMKAPRMKVMEKLLNAHKHRSLRMISQFNQQFSKPTTASTAFTAGSVAVVEVSVKDMLTDLTNARKFAQFLVVGLIEACKGVFDLFQQNYLEGTSDEAHLKEARQAYAELHIMIQTVVHEYTKSMNCAFGVFFECYNAHFMSLSIDYAEDFEADRGSSGSRGTTEGGVVVASDEVSDEVNSAVNNNNNTTSDVSSGVKDSEELQTARFKSAELQDERNKWLQLARQSINDVVYLDSTQLECFNNCQYPSENSSSSASERFQGYARSYSSALLQSISAHCEVLQAHRITCYLNSVASVLPKVQSLCNCKATSNSGVTVGSEVSRPKLGGGRGALHSADPAAERATLTRNTAAVKKIIDFMVSQAVVCFSEVARDFKATVDIYEVSSKDIEEAVVAVILKHCDKLVLGVESLCGVINHKFVFNPLTGICESVTAGVDVLHGQNNNGNNSTGDGSEDLASDDIELIYTEKDVSSGSSSSSGRLLSDTHSDLKVSSAAAGSTDSLSSSSAATSTSTAVAVSRCYLLLFAGVLRKLFPVFVDEVNLSLADFDLPTVQYRHELRSHCSTRLEVTCQLLLQSFLDVNAEQCARLLSHSQYEVFTTFYLQSSANTASTEAVKSASLISDKVLTLSKFLDVFTVLCCVMLNESPPPLKVHSAMELRRGGGVGHRSSVLGGAAGGHHNNLQLDIERLFSQRIKVFDRVSASASLDYLVSTLIKSALKATQESIRCMSLPTAAYVHVQANITFMKQVTACVVRECTDCDNLVEQCLSAVFARYLDANDIANAADGNEVSLIAKGISEAFAKLHDHTVLVARVTA